jgi:hypothetical protein
MTAIRAYLDATQVGQTFEKISAKYPERVRAAARAATAEMASAIEEKGREDIASAGRFGSRWTEGFQAKVTEGGGSIKVDVTEAVPYWTVFEYGADIRAKNPSGLLWIPLSFADVPEGVWAKDYPGRLFRVSRSERLPSLMEKAPRTAKWLGAVRTLGARFSTADKAPLLFSVTDRQPKYFGKPYVHVPQLFHLRAIIKQESARLPLLFRTSMKAAASGLSRPDNRRDHRQGRQRQRRAGRRGLRPKVPGWRAKRNQPDADAARRWRRRRWRRRGGRFLPEIRAVVAANR